MNIVDLLQNHSDARDTDAWMSCLTAKEEIERLQSKVNSLMTAIYEAGDLLDAGQYIDASNRLDEAKFNHSMEKVS